MLEDFQSVRLTSLFAHYRQSWRDERPPSRADIDPSRIIPALPYTYIVQVEHGRDEQTAFRVRLFGTRLVDLFKAELTGRMIGDVDMGDWGREWRSTLRYALRTRRPVLSVHELEIKRTSTTLEQVILPLSKDGFSVDRLIGAIDVLETETRVDIGSINRIDWASTRSVSEAGTRMLA